MILPADFCVFWGWDEETARSYIKDNGLTSDMVRMGRIGQNIVIYTKGQIEWPTMKPTF